VSCVFPSHLKKAENSWSNLKFCWSTDIYTSQWIIIKMQCLKAYSSNLLFYSRQTSWIAWNQNAEPEGILPLDQCALPSPKTCITTHMEQQKKLKRYWECKEKLKMIFSN
jgi:hypothetical protein